MTDHNNTKMFAHSPPDPRPLNNRQTPLNPKLLNWDQAHPLIDHLLKVKLGAGERAKVFGAQSYGEILGQLHDLGKYRLNFQAYVRGTPLQGLDKSHKWAGAALAARIPSGGRLLALAIAGHHGGIPSVATLLAEFGKGIPQAELEDALRFVLGR